MTDQETKATEPVKTKTISEKLYHVLVGSTVALLIAVIVLGVLYSNAAHKKVVAVVDDMEITQQELYDQMKPTAGEASLNSLIEEKLVQKALEEEDITVTEQEIDAERQEVIATFPSEAEFKTALEENNLTEEKFREDIVRYLKIDKLMTERIEVTEEEMEQRYEKDPTLSQVAAQVEANHILVETEAEAQEVKAKLAAGESFADLAKEHSIDEQNAENGGSLGAFGKGTMEAAFEEAVFAMTEPGQISEPVQTSFGFHIIELVSITPEQTKTYEEVKEEIREALFTEKTNAEYADWVTELKENAEIKGTI